MDIGQITQVSLRFRALKKPDGSFIFREMLRSISILNDGISAVSGSELWLGCASNLPQELARSLSERCAKPRAKRELKAYPVYKQSRMGGPATERMNE